MVTVTHNKTLFSNIYDFVMLLTSYIYYFHNIILANWNRSLFTLCYLEYKQWLKNVTIPVGPVCYLFQVTCQKMMNEIPSIPPIVPGAGLIAAGQGAVLPRLLGCVSGDPGQGHYALYIQ